MRPLREFKLESSECGCKLQLLSILSPGETLVVILPPPAYPGLGVVKVPLTSPQGTALFFLFFLNLTRQLY